MLVLGLRLVGDVVVVVRLRDRVVRSRLRIVVVRVVENAWPKVWISVSVWVSPVPEGPEAVHKNNMIVRMMVVSVVRMIAAIPGVVGSAVRGGPVGHTGPGCNGAYSAKGIRWRARGQSRGCHSPGSDRPESWTRCKNPLRKAGTLWIPPAGAEKPGRAPEKPMCEPEKPLRGEPVKPPWNPARWANVPQESPAMHYRDRSETLHKKILRPFKEFDEESKTIHPKKKEIETTSRFPPP